MPLFSTKQRLLVAQNFLLTASVPGNSRSFSVLPVLKIKKPTTESVTTKKHPYAIARTAANASEEVERRRALGATATRLGIRATKQ
jgi:hypothetical protein